MAIPTVSPGDPNPTGWANNIGAALSYVQYIPPVGDTFTSNYFGTSSTAVLRDRATAPMPILITETITIDQISFNLTVVATTNTTGILAEYFWDQSAGTYSRTTLAGTVPLTGSTGQQDIAITPLVLNPGLHFIGLYQGGSYDTAVRVTQATLTGPGTGPWSGFSATANSLPWGANTATVTAVPVLRLRRSA